MIPDLAIAQTLPDQIKRLAIVVPAVGSREVMEWSAARSVPALLGWTRQRMTAVVSGPRKDPALIKVVRRVLRWANNVARGRADR